MQKHTLRKILSAALAAVIAASTNVSAFAEDLLGVGEVLGKWDTASFAKELSGVDVSGVRQVVLYIVNDGVGTATPKFDASLNQSGGVNYTEEWNSIEWGPASWDKPISVTDGSLTLDFTPENPWYNKVVVQSFADFAWLVQYIVYYGADGSVLFDDGDSSVAGDTGNSGENVPTPPPYIPPYVPAPEPPASTGDIAVSPPPPATSSNVDINGAVKADTVLDKIKAATEKLDADKLNLIIKNANIVEHQTLKQLADQAKELGITTTLLADTTKDGKIETRLYINPADFAGLDADIKLGASIDQEASQKVIDKFDKAFGIKPVVIALEQRGEFGASVEIATKVDLSDLDTDTLHFYSYDAKTGIYTQIKTKYIIDKNGFLHFVTPLGGDILITDKPLKK